MASNFIIPWQIDGGKVEAVTNLIFLGSKSTADGDYSLKIKRHLFLGKNTMTNLDNVVKAETSLSQQRSI